MGTTEWDVADESIVQVMDVYPNPVTGAAVTVQSQSMRGDFQLQVFDLSGRLAVDQPIRAYIGSPLNLDVSGLKNGTYVVRMANGQFQQTAKMLIRR